MFFQSSILRCYKFSLNTSQAVLCSESCPPKKVKSKKSKAGIRLESKIRRKSQWLKSFIHFESFWFEIRGKQAVKSWKRGLGGKCQSWKKKNIMNRIGEIETRSVCIFRPRGFPLTGSNRISEIMVFVRKFKTLIKIVLLFDVIHQPQRFGGYGKTKMGRH